VGAGAAADGCRSSHEYRSRLRIGGLPLLHIVRGVDPATGRRRAAVGVVAVGQVAVGVVAVGQLAIGGVTVGQASFGLLGGVGQLATGLVALGQIAFGTVGAAGQIAAAPCAVGLVHDAGPWAGALWLAVGALVGLTVLARLQRLRPLISAGTVTTISALRDGVARIAGRVVSENALRTPISNRPCVHWQARRMGPGVHTCERQGREILVEDQTGTARVELGRAVTLFQPGAYSELPALDWSLQLESYLSKGDDVVIAGTVAVEPDPEGDGTLYRNAPVRAVFRGRAGAPVLVSTQPPAELRAECRVSLGLAALFSLAAAAALAPFALPIGAAATGFGLWLGAKTFQS